MPKEKVKGQRAKNDTKTRQNAKSQTQTNVKPSRRLKPPKRYWYKPWTWSKRLPPPPRPPLLKARKICRQAVILICRNWKLFGGIILIYGILNILLVRGLSGSDNLTTIKSMLDSIFHGAGGKLTSAFVSFAYLLGSSGSGNTAASGAYQTMLLIVVGLAFIWALRQTTASNKVRIRDSFYRGMYPLVPFVILLVIIGIQLLPLVIGGSLLSTILGNGIAVHAYEKLLWWLLFIVLGLWSLRMVTSSIFALFIVTLPDMTPLRALRSAKELVYGRRLMVWRKLIFMPIIMLIVALIIELPLILYVTPLATWVFFVLSMLALAFVTSYLYGTYRELLND